MIEIFVSHPTKMPRLVHRLMPGECVAALAPLGIIVRNTLGQTFLFGTGRDGHPVALEALTPALAWFDHWGDPL